MAAAILAFSLALKATKDITIADIGKALLVLGSLTAMLAVIMAASKVGRFTPLAVSFAKVVLSIWGLLKMVLWLFDQLKNYTDRTINNGLKVMDAITKAFVTIVLVMKISQMINKGMKITTLSDVGHIMIAAALVIASVALFLNAVKGLTPEEIGRAELLFVIVCAVTAVMYAGLVGLSALPLEPVNLAEIKVGGIMAAISATTFMMLGAIYLAAGLSPSQIEVGGRRILMLYGVIGAIAGALLLLSKISAITTKYGIIRMATSKATGLSIGKDGLKGTGSGMASTPIGSLILAIGITTALLVIMLEWAANMDESTWETGRNRIFQIVGVVAGIAAVLMLISKIPFKSEGKKTIKMTSSLILILAAISVVAFVLYNIAQIPADQLKLAAIIAGAIMAAVIVMLYLMAGAAAIFGKVKMSAIGKLFIGIVLMTAIFASLKVLAWSLETLGPALNEFKTNSIGKLAAILGIVSFFVALIAIVTGVTGGIGIAVIAAGIAAIALFGPALRSLAWGLELLGPALNEFKTNSIGKLAAILAIILAFSILAVIAIPALVVIALLGPVLAAFAWGLREANPALEDLKNTLKDFSDDDIDKLTRIATGLLALGASEIVEAIGNLINSFVNWITGGSPIDKIANSLDKLDESKLDKFTSFVEIISKLNDIDPALGKHLKDIKALIDGIEDLNFDTNNYKSLLELLKFLTPTNNIMVYQIAMKYLSTIKDLLNSDIDIEPKVTPVFDFTQFDSGLVYMKNSLGGLNSVYIAQKAQNDYNDAKRVNTESGGKSSGGNEVIMGSGITVNVTENITDPLNAGYQTTRTVRNAIEDAVKTSMGKGHGSWMFPWRK